MRPVVFPGHNVVLQPPASMPDVSPLPVRRSGNVVVSCWEMEPGDLDEVNRTGRVYLIVEGPTHAPLRLSTLPPEE